MNTETLDFLTRCLNKSCSHYTLNNRQLSIRYNGFADYETLYFKEQSYQGCGWDDFSDRIV